MPALRVQIAQVVTKLLVSEVRQKLPRVKLFNTYSISECGEIASSDLTLLDLDSGIIR